MLTSPAAVARRTAFLEQLREEENEKQRLSRLATYDTLQLKATWVRRRRVWLGVSGLYNSARQPLFDPTAPEKGYKRTAYDQYGEGKLSLNSLWMYRRSKIYASGSVGLSGMLDLKKDDQKTYQSVIWQPYGADSVQVVRQSQAYPSFPAEVTFRTVQLQYALYYRNAVGIDLTYKGQFAQNYSDRNAATFGIFFPFATGDTNLLVMPQAKWSDARASRQWTFGFNISVSIPGFVTKDKK